MQRKSLHSLHFSNFLLPIRTTSEAKPPRENTSRLSKNLPRRSLLAKTPAACRKIFRGEASSRKHRPLAEKSSEAKPLKNAATQQVYIVYLLTDIQRKLYCIHNLTKQLYHEEDLHSFFADSLYHDNSFRTER
jgi:hypothetical protein